MGLGLNVHRQGDICTGHGCWPPRKSIAGSPNVNINGIPAHRQGDAWDSHCCPGQGCHSSQLQSGSSSINVNGLQLARVGDPVACGSKASGASCSPNVFGGG